MKNKKYIILSTLYGLLIVLFGAAFFTNSAAVTQPASVEIAVKAVAQETITWNSKLYQGDTLLVTFKDQPQSATLGSEPLSLLTYKGALQGILGIPATKPAGVYSLKVVYPNGKTDERTIRVLAQKFTRVTFDAPVGVTPDELVKKLAEEKAVLDAMVSVKSPQPLTAPFGLPLMKNRVTTPFGEIRKTGNQEIRHLGADFGGAIGTPIGAINSGVVKKAYTDTLYGNSVVIDHGQGIFSLYLHLNQIKIKEGETVRKGQVIGTVGKTGYATGPHLHLSVKVNGVSIDPLRFVSLWK